PTVDPDELRIVPSLSMRPIEEPDELRMVPSASTFPIEEPDELRTEPSPSILPIDEPDEFRMVPSLPMRPVDEPELLRTVPSDSPRPTEEPDELRSEIPAMAMSARASTTKRPIANAEHRRDRGRGRMREGYHAQHEPSSRPSRVRIRPWETFDREAASIC